mgnify:CR=1 FL=1|jgi:hypothetical protein
MGLLDILGGKRKLMQALDKLDPIVKPKLAKLIAKEFPQVATLAPAIADRTVDLVEELLVAAL